MAQVVPGRVLLRCLNLLEEPTSGEIIIDGIPLVEQRKDINRLRQKVGMVFSSLICFLT